MEFVNETITRLRSTDYASMNQEMRFINDENSDFLRATDDGTAIVKCTMLDFTEGEKAHIDGIQIIPTNKKISFRYQYMGGEIANLIISENKVYSPYNTVQGVFSSDGLLRNVSVINNQFLTRSRHKITLGGLLSGTISGNTDLYMGSPAPVYLYPLRIGGGLNDYRTWILSFSDKEKYSYDSLDKIMPNEEDMKYTYDLREVPINEGDIYLHDFDLDAYIQEASKIKDRNIKDFIPKITDLAFSFGRLV